MIKIILIAILCGIVCLYLKQNNSDFFPLGLIASGIILFFQTSDYIIETFNIINDILALSGIDNQTLKTIIKISVIGILIEFSAELLTDLGLSSLSNKLILFGKIIIISMCLPMIYSVYAIIQNLLEL